MHWAIFIVRCCLLLHSIKRVYVASPPSDREALFSTLSLLNRGERIVFKDEPSFHRFHTFSPVSTGLNPLYHNGVYACIVSDFYQCSILVKRNGSAETAHFPINAITATPSVLIPSPPSFFFSDTIYPNTMTSQLGHLGVTLLSSSESSNRDDSFQIQVNVPVDPKNTPNFYRSVHCMFVQTALVRLSRIKWSLFSGLRNKNLPFPEKRIHYVRYSPCSVINNEVSASLEFTSMNNLSDARGLGIYLFTNDVVDISLSILHSPSGTFQLSNILSLRQRSSLNASAHSLSLLVLNNLLCDVGRAFPEFVRADNECSSSTIFREHADMDKNAEVFQDITSLEGPNAKYKMWLSASNGSVNCIEGRCVVKAGNVDKPMTLLSRSIKITDAQSRLLFVTGTLLVPVHSHVLLEIVIDVAVASAEKSSDAKHLESEIVRGRYVVSLNLDQVSAVNVCLLHSQDNQDSHSTTSTVNQHNTPMYSCSFAYVFDLPVTCGHLTVSVQFSGDASQMEDLNFTLAETSVFSNNLSKITARRGLNKMNMMQAFRSFLTGSSGIDSSFLHLTKDWIFQNYPFHACELHKMRDTLEEIETKLPISSTSKLRDVLNALFTHYMSYNQSLTGSVNENGTAASNKDKPNCIHLDHFSRTIEKMSTKYNETIQHYRNLQQHLLQLEVATQSFHNLFSVLSTILLGTSLKCTFEKHQSVTELKLFEQFISKINSSFSELATVESNLRGKLNQLPESKVNDSKLNNLQENVNQIRTQLENSHTTVSALINEYTQCTYQKADVSSLQRFSNEMVDALKAKMQEALLPAPVEDDSSPPSKRGTTKTEYEQFLDGVPQLLDKITRLSELTDRIRCRTDLLHAESEKNTLETQQTRDGYRETTSKSLNLLVDTDVFLSDLILKTIPELQEVKQQIATKQHSILQDALPRIMTFQEESGKIINTGSVHSKTIVLLMSLVVLIVVLFISLAVGVGMCIARTRALRGIS